MTELTEKMKDKMLERETTLNYNELDNQFELCTYDLKLKKRFSKNKSCEIKELNDDNGTYFFITGNKNDLNIDIF